MDTDVRKLIDGMHTAFTDWENQRAGARERLINQAQKLISTLELPSEAIQRMGWAEPARSSHCQIAVDLGIFDTLKALSPASVDVQTLASSTSASEVFLSRFLRHLAATNVIEEESSGRYRATPFSLALTEPRFRDGITYVNRVAGPSFRAMPAYFQRIGYDNPTSLIDGPFQFAHQTQLPFFDWIDEKGFLQTFNNYMTACQAGKPTWCDTGFYPVQENLVAGFENSKGRTFLVDVGGGLGHDLQELRAKHPGLPGELVLQDRRDVISTVSGDSKSRGFEAAAHDFFTTQPIKGARAYYLHSVLHDWSDDDCIKIISNLVPVLEPWYSKVLINEIVVPASGATWPVTSMDWLMMALGAMRERTQQE